MEKTIEQMIAELKHYSELTAKLESSAKELRQNIEDKLRKENLSQYKDTNATVSLVKKTTVKYDKEKFLSFCSENKELNKYIFIEPQLNKEFDEDLIAGSIAFPDFVEVPEFNVITKENIAIRFK